MASETKDHRAFGRALLTAARELAQENNKADSMWYEHLARACHRAMASFEPPVPPAEPVHPFTASLRSAGLSEGYPVLRINYLDGDQIMEMDRVVCHSVEDELRYESWERMPFDTPEPVTNHA